MYYNPFDVIVPDWAMWLMGIIFLVIFIAPPLLHFFYKGVVRQIVVVKCRKTTHDIYDINIMSKWRYNNTSSIIHMTIDYQYIGKRFVFTANCYDSEVFKKLKVGSTYMVRIRLNTIVSIVKQI